MRFTGSCLRNPAGPQHCTVPRPRWPRFWLTSWNFPIPNGISPSILTYHCSILLPQQGTFGTSTFKVEAAFHSILLSHGRLRHPFHAKWWQGRLLLTHFTVIGQVPSAVLPSKFPQVRSRSQSPFPPTPQTSRSTLIPLPIASCLREGIRGSVWEGESCQFLPILGTPISSCSFLEPSQLVERGVTFFYWSEWGKHHSPPELGQQLTTSVYSLLLSMEWGWVVK